MNIKSISILTLIILVIYIIILLVNFSEDVEQNIRLAPRLNKKDIDDIRESPCLEIIHLLSGKVKETRVFDPFVSSKSTVATMDDAVKGADVVMLGTNHTEMTAILTPEYLKSMGVKLVVDGKNAIDGQVMANAGIPYYGIGRTYADTI